MTVGGMHWIAGDRQRGDGPGFRAIAAGTGQEIGPEYRDAAPAQVALAAAAAGEAAAQFSASEPARRASLLRGIAAGLLGCGEELLAVVHEETALPPERLAAERARTVQQLRMFADLIEDGSWVDARIDHGDPDRRPVPKPDLRTMLVPLGPVAVFGASNFPLAYSVAGGDTASALAAGCPVVVKGHPAHPMTSELVAAAITGAVAAAALPAGVFSLVHGRAAEVGAGLVSHPAIAAVGFTGSAAGGEALFRLATARPVPIPVFAEMGSTNPVFVLPGALAERGPALAAQLAASATLGVGQYCTCPGLVLHEGSAAGDAFVQELSVRFAATPAGPMVHPNLKAGYERALAARRGLPGIRHAAAGAQGGGWPGTAAAAELLATDAATVLAFDVLREEAFGPALVVARYGNRAELLAVAASLHGHLTATVHGTEDDLARHGDLLAILRRKVGRLLFGGVPTGVEVCAAMQHGGPWPASSDSRFTAVGPRAILRWVRPLCLQGAPPRLLPAELQDGNPRRIWRTVDGVLGRH